MKKIFLFLLALHTLAFANENETQIKQLIENTAKQLEAQKKLQQLMLEFNAQKEDFILGNQTKPHAARMVKSAKTILDTITTEKLKYLFTTDYLEELAFFSSIAEKKTPSPP